VKELAAENVVYSILALLLTRGFDRTLEHFCTFPVFSIA
jgi:hypothetical protein